MFKKYWELIVGGIVTIITIIVSISWLGLHFISSDLAEPIISITAALLAFLVFVVSFKAIMANSSRKTFEDTFNIEMKKLWVEFGALIREGGTHDGEVDFEDNMNNIILLSNNHNNILKKDVIDDENEYHELIEFPDKFENGALVSFYVNKTNFETRANYEKIEPILLARLAAAQMAYKVNESYLDFSAESTEFDEEKAIISIECQKNFDKAEDAVEIVALLRYLIILQLALD